MVVSCSICGEQYGVTEDVTFHKFPANEERRKKWVSAVQRDSWLPGKRSMLCSKHFSHDKFVYKVSGEKVRRYLMPDTIPTIFDTSNRKSKIKTSLQLDAKNGVSSSTANSLTNVTAVELNSVKPGVDLAVADTTQTLNSTGSINLEILAATSVALEPYLIVTEPGLIKVEKNISNAIPKSVQTPAATSIAVASSSATSLGEKDQNQETTFVNFPGTTERACHAMRIETDLTPFPKRPRQVYPGDFKQLNYNDVTEVSRSWTVLNNYVKKMRTNMKVLRQRNRRLEKRVTDLKSVVKFLKNRIVARDSAAVRLCGNSDLPGPTEALPKEYQLFHLSNPLVDHDYTSVNDKSIS